MKIKYEMHEQEMTSKKEDMSVIEESISILEEKMMMQAFEFGFGFILHNMDVIMNQIEPAVLRFNSMLSSVLSLTTIENGELAAHPMVALIRERTTDIVNATSHLIYYMEGENDNGAQDFVDTMMEICSELKNKTNDYETFPMMKMVVDMLPGGYDASRQSTAAFILSVAKHYQMWFKWENLYEEVMDSYKKMSSMKKKINDGDHYEMNDSPMPNTPLAQFFMENMGNQMGADGHRRPHGNNRPHHGPNRPGARRPSYKGDYKQNSVKEMAMHMMNQEDMDIDYMVNFGMNMFGKAMEMFNGM